MFLSVVVVRFLASSRVAKGGFFVKYSGFPLDLGTNGSRLGLVSLGSSVILPLLVVLLGMNVLGVTGLEVSLVPGLVEGLSVIFLG